MSPIRKYKLIYMTIGLFVSLSGSLFLSNLPMKGYLQANNAAISFRFGYFGEQQNKLDLREWINKFKDISLFAAADRLYPKTNELPLHSFLPVFDSSSTVEQFNEVYNYLPTSDQSPYGREVYSVDYGDARFIFLEASSLSKSSGPQLNWLRKTVNQDNKMIHNIVLLNQDPKLPAVWEAMLETGVNLVLIGDEVYVPQIVLTQEAAEYRTTVYPGWGIWDVYHQFAQPHMLIIEGADNKLVVQVRDQQGKGLDQLTQDVTNLRYKDNLNERALVSIQSLWRFHHGSKDIKAVIPPELDITGENPIQKPFTLPGDDWRSPSYDDSTWAVGRGPLGHSQDIADHRIIQTVLPKSGESPVYYFRKTFELRENPLKISNLLLHTMYEDGFVVYLNGSEVYRDSIREGLVDYRSLAFPSEANFYAIFPIKHHLDKLVQGTNTIAVEIHRSHPKAPNLLFDLSLSYEE